MYGYPYAISLTPPSGHPCHTITTSHSQPQLRPRLPDFSHRQWGNLICLHPQCEHSRLCTYRLCPAATRLRYSLSLIPLPCPAELICCLQGHFLTVFPSLSKNSPQTSTQDQHCRESLSFQMLSLSTKVFWHQ